MTEHRWVMISGVGPGAGKSTLAAGLARELRGAGAPVDLIPEEDLFVRAEFAEAATGFREKRFESMSQDLLAAYARLVEKAEREGSVVIFDWEAAGMVEDLPWAQDQSALDTHVQSVMDTVRAFQPVVLFLEAPLRLAYERAVAERGDPWVTRYAGLGAERGLGRHGSPQQRALAYLRANQAWRARTDAAYAAAGWPVTDVDATLGAGKVLADALAVCGYSFQ